MSNKKIEYPLTFQEALENVMAGNGWAQGEEFRDGVIMMEKGGMFMRGKEHLHIHSFDSDIEFEKTPILITQGLIRQKFRMVSTQADAMRKA